MIGRIEGFFLKLRRALSRSEWMVRLLGLQKIKGREAEPGIVLIQIDGLAYLQLKKALKKHRMPFLTKLMQKEAYGLQSLYSGLPSNTPSFQGELFYGVKGCVPAFSYKNRETNKIIRMYEPQAAAALQKKLEQSAEGLLQGGSAYSNIFSGGAKESSFCAATLDWTINLRGAKALAVAIFILSNIWSFVRVGALLILELLLAIVDCIRGLIAGLDIWKELRFVPARVAISILLRELVCMNAMLDTARGLPIIHLNFLGYDEQAHRRGPSSAFAHWTLKGIDDAIKRVWKAAKRSGRRDYEVWIYSDHGQETSRPYEAVYGRSIEDAISKIIEQGAYETPEKKKGIQLHRAQWIGLPIRQWPFSRSNETESPLSEKMVITAMGPVAHVYTKKYSSWKERHATAQKIVQKAKVPMVAIKDAQGSIQMITEEGVFQVPTQAEAIFGTDHPHLHEVAKDMESLCHHPDSGDYVLFAWSKNGRSLSFPGENGAHAGPGPSETTGFVLLPNTADMTPPIKRSLRALDLREGVLRSLGRAPAFPRRHRRKPQKHDIIRIMTYNVHSCIGMDGKLSPERIARVIEQYDPDIVALQELDVGRHRTNTIDQAERIAQTLSMDFHFHAAMQLKEEEYGNAILSHHPIRLMQAKQLPKQAGRIFMEPRGALWVNIEIAGVEYKIINTHLGLSRRERLLQCEALLGPEWVGHGDCLSPVILCGDFNAGPRTRVCKKFTHTLHDAQDILSHHRPESTWFGRYPINRIDHIFVDHALIVDAVQVPRTTLTRVASDHLPLIVDLRLG